MVRKVADFLLALLLMLLSANWFGITVPVLVLAILSGATAVVIITSMMVDKP